MPYVEPLDPALFEQAARVLARRGAYDIAEMLGIEMSAVA